MARSWNCYQLCEQATDPCTDDSGALLVSDAGRSPLLAKLLNLAPATSNRVGTKTSGRQRPEVFFCVRVYIAPKRSIIWGVANT